jgi:serine/threonine protein kinase
MGAPLGPNSPGLRLGVRSPLARAALQPWWWQAGTFAFYSPCQSRRGGKPLSMRSGGIPLYELLQLPAPSSAGAERTLHRAARPSARLEFIRPRFTNSSLRGRARSKIAPHARCFMIPTGTKIGPYQILATLGAGGMGEVYRARDQRLGRDVAVKVLPASLSADRDRLRRFEQEARAVAALEHPNIMAIHDVGDDAGVHFLVSELLEGESLRDRLQHGPVPARRAVEYAKQVADGLAAAHEKGIVHRDLKPDNIFITRDGRVKILDFGLAKLDMTQAFAAAADASATIGPATTPGVVLGTTGYMAPEQVRGDIVDHRADIFAFGAVFYEMLCGERAFKGSTSIETMHAILKEDPPDIMAGNRSLSPAVARIVEHCLEKRPEDRFQSARDLAFALTAISSLSTTDAKPIAETKRPLLLWALGVGAVLVVGALSFFAVRGTRTVAPVQFKRLTFSHKVINAARFAADPKSAVYTILNPDGTLHLETANADFPASRPLDIPNASLYAVSSTGEMAVGINGGATSHGIYRGTLARVPLGGGSPREILDDVIAADWSPDGAQLAVAHYVGSENRLEYPIGHVLYRTGGWISDVRVSPHGDRVAFMDHEIWPDDRGRVTVVTTDGKLTVLTKEYSSAEGLAWAPQAGEIWFTASEGGIDYSAYAVTLSGKVRKILAIPGSLTLRDIDRAGNVLFSRDELNLLARVKFADTADEQDATWLDWTYVSDISHDGKLLVFDEQGDGGGPLYSACLLRPGGSPPVRLGEGYVFALSPDQQNVLVGVPSRPGRLMILPVGAGTAREVPLFGLDTIASGDWLPDGKHVLIAAGRKGSGFREYIVDIEGAAPPKPITPEGTFAASSLSPDGKKILLNDADGRTLISALNDGQARALPGIAPHENVIGWNTDGTAVYVVANSSGPPAKIFLVNITTGERRPWRDIGNDLRGSTVGRIGPIVMSRDGNAYAYSYARGSSDLFVATGVR